jgi:hypothetical protein
MGIGLVAPTQAVRREAARLRGDGVSLGDGFAIAAARSGDAWIATYDRRVRRSLDGAGVQLAPNLD